MVKIRPKIYGQAMQFSASPTKMAMTIVTLKAAPHSAQASNRRRTSGSVTKPKSLPQAVLM